MTAHRPRETGPLSGSTIIEVLFASAPVSRSGLRVGRTSQIWCPPTDVYETEEKIVVQVEIAGMQPDQLRIMLHDRWLSINGVRQEERNTERRAYHQMEIHFGEFRSEVELPGPVDRERIEAEYGQGFLRITLPKP